MIFSQHAIWKNNRLLVLFFFFTLSARAQTDWKEVLGPSGSVRSSYWKKDKSFDEVSDYAVGSVWLTLRPAEVFGSKLFFEGFVQDQNLSRKSVAYGDVREAYLEKAFGDLDIKVGRQIIVWGRADKFNPTDSFSTKNLTFLSSDDEDQRLGQFASQIRYHFNQFQLIGIWQSEWRESDFPSRTQAGVTISQLRPDNSQNQFGLKLDASGGEIDWSLSYFDGFNRTPNLKVLAVGSELNLGLEYGHIRTYGADFAKNIGEYGLRGEIAHSVTDDDAGADSLKQNSFSTIVFGADRTLVENLNVNVQGIYKSVARFSDPDSIADPNTRFLAQRGALISNQKYQEQFGFSIRPSYKLLNETLEIEIAFITWQKSGDSLTKPKVTYAFSDRFKGIAGGEFYNGSIDTLFGQLKDTSSGYFELRYLF